MMSHDCSKILNSSFGRVATPYIMYCGACSACGYQPKMSTYQRPSCRNDEMFAKLPLLLDSC